MPRPKGSHISAEHRRKIAIALLGNKNGVGHCKHPKLRAKRISETRLKLMRERGWLNSANTRKKISLSLKGNIPWNKGKKFSVTSRKKMSLSAYKRLADPKNHPRWLNGISFEPYPCKFTKQLKLKIRTRDDFTCQLCSVKEEDYFQKLSVNHIDYVKDNCREENLITLCRGCNSKVNANRDHWKSFFKRRCND